MIQTTSHELEMHIKHARKNNLSTLELNGKDFIEDIGLSTSVDLVFTNCNFRKIVTLVTGAATYKFRDCKKIRIIETHRNCSIHLSNCGIESLMIHGSSVYIDNKSKIDRLTTGSELGTLDCKDSEINNLTVSSEILSYSHITNTTIYNHIDIYLKGGKKFELYKSTIMGGITLYNPSESGFSINSCIFSKGSYIQFFCLDLKNVILQSLDLKNTYLLFQGEGFNFTYSDVEFPTDIDKYKIKNEDWITTRTIFRKLKQTFELNLDFIQARTYASMELEAYFNHEARQRYKITKKRSFPFFEIENAPLSVAKNFPFISANYWPFLKIQHYPLLISKVSNEFGRNWWLPILWLIDLSAIFFSLSSLLILSNYSYLESIPIGVSLWNKGIFFEYLFPVHTFDIFEGYRTGALIHLIDLVQRIFSGFLIFQFIRAFRFHVAK